MTTADGVLQRMKTTHFGVWVLLLFMGSVAAADGLLWDDDFAAGDRTDRWEFQPANAAYWRYEYADDGIHMQSAWDSATHYRALRRGTTLPDAYILRARFVYRDVFATWSRAGFGLYDPERKEMRCFHVQYSPETKMFRLASMLLADGAAFDTAAGVVESPEQPFTPGAVFDLTLEKKPGDGGYVFSASSGGAATRLEVAAADAARFTRLALTSYVSLGTWQRIALSGPGLSDEAFRSLPVGRGPVAADPDARGAPDYSFETDDDLRAWVPQGTTVARSTDWAADGSHSLRVAVGKLPWHGIAQKVDLRTWRDAEFLELDLRAGTALERLILLLRGDSLQDALVMFDNLEAGETRHVRFRIADNPMVQYGTNALFQIYTNNDSDERPAVFYVDRIRLTGPGPAARTRAAIAANAARQGITLAPDQDGDVAALTAEIRRRHDGLPFLIGVATPLERTPRATPPGGYAGLIEPAEATLELAANEAESLLVTAWAEAGVRGIDAAVSGLPAGVTAQVFWADDVSIAGTRQKPGKELTALVPDPLLPVEEFKPGAAADNATLLVQLRAGPDALAGDHAAKLSLTVNGARRTLPLRLRVFGFRLPQKPTLGTMFNLWAHDWVNFYRYARYPTDAWFHQLGFPDVPPERMAEVVRFLGDYRVGVGGMPTWATAMGKVTPEIDKGNGAWDFSTWERTVEACLAHTDDVPLGEISGQAVREGRVDPAGAEQLAKVATALQQAIAAHPAWKQAGVCFQLKDEVRTRQEREDAVSEGLLVKRHAPDLRLVLVTCCGIPPADDALFDPIDVLVSLNDRLELREMKKHQAAGKRVFWYPCNVVYEPFCNFAVGSQPIAPRMLPVLSHANGVDGVLYWAANLFGAANCDPDRPDRWPDVPWSMEGWPYPPGEGHLYYPGRGGSPWPSLRLENWRDGMEDYEYLALLAARRDALPDDARREADRLLALEGIAAAPFDYTLDGAAYRAWRRALADLIDRAGAAPSGGRRPVP